MSQIKKTQDVEVSKEQIRQQYEYIDKIAELISKNFPEGYMPLAHVHSFGCQQNVADGEKIKGMLALMGYGFTEDPSEADFVLYNTCAVREHAQDRVFGNVGELKHYKANKKSMIIALCGCMVQQEEVTQKVKKSYPYVDLVFGTHAMYMFPELLYTYMKQGKRVFNIDDKYESIAEGLPVKRDGTIKAWLPIMYGCNNFCSYCIVPYVRGRERSRKPELIIEEAKELVKNGYKEITLLGQNVNSYGKGLEEEINFSKLLRMLNEIEGDFQIRFMTSHPKDASYELIDTIAECDKVCKHLHLPVQCGSDRILKLMNRHYDKNQYLDLIHYAKKKIKNLTLSSDIIVGFPGETYEDFKQTLDLIKTVEYDVLYTFIYSKRTGTKAAEMDDPISKQDKSLWFRELLDVQNDIGYNKNKQLIGKTIRVLTDSKSKLGEGYISGRTDGNIIANLKADDSFIGQFVTMKVTNASNTSVSGELI